MIEIGPNLTGVLMAIVALLASAIAIWRAEHAIGGQTELSKRVDGNTAKLMGLPDEGAYVVKRTGGGN